MHGGRIEQVGSPADMYGSPATPFVAEFIGTMNRLVSTVAGDGVVEYGGKALRVDAARGWAQGDRVLLLVRPETVEVEAAPDGSEPEGTLAGTVVSHNFLGSVTRIKIDTAGGEVTADIPTARMGTVAIGARVRASSPADSPRLLNLED